MQLDPCKEAGLLRNVTFYLGGAEVLDAQIGIADASTADANVLTLTREMIANGPAIAMFGEERFALDISGGPAAEIKPVIVHAGISAQGRCWRRR